MKKNEIQTNIQVIDFTETYQLLYGSTRNEPSLKSELIDRLAQIYSSSLPTTPSLGKPTTSRASIELFLQGGCQEVDGSRFKTQYFSDKVRFEFTENLYKKFQKEVVKGNWISISLGYDKVLKDGEVNGSDYCQKEFQKAWLMLVGVGKEEELFYNMGKLSIQLYFLTRPGLKPNTPNQVWMERFGFNEGVSSMLNKWFWVNLLSFDPKEFKPGKHRSIYTNNTFQYK
jgi:hypothetical protein